MRQYYFTVYLLLFLKDLLKMENQLTEFTRTKSLFGYENFEKIQNAHVAVFGIGGVGGYVVEALVRSGIQKIDIIDNDTVSLTNINRQIIATHSTIGKYKVDVMKARILDINPNAHVNCFKCFYLFSSYSYLSAYAKAFGPSSGTFGLPLIASYEIDLFGKNHNKLLMKTMRILFYLICV